MSQFPASFSPDGAIENILRKYRNDLVFVPFLSHLQKTLSRLRSRELVPTRIREFGVGDLNLGRSLLSQQSAVLFSQRHPLLSSGAHARMSEHVFCSFTLSVVYDLVSLGSVFCEDTPTQEEKGHAILGLLGRLCRESVPPSSSSQFRDHLCESLESHRHLCEICGLVGLDIFFVSSFLESACGRPLVILSSSPILFRPPPLSPSGQVPVERESERESQEEEEEGEGVSSEVGEEGDREREGEEEGEGEVTGEATGSVGSSETETETGTGEERERESSATTDPESESESASSRGQEPETETDEAEQDGETVPSEEPDSSSEQSTSLSIPSSSGDEARSRARAQSRDHPSPAASASVTASASTSGPSGAWKKPPRDGGRRRSTAAEIAAIPPDQRRQRTKVDRVVAGRKNRGRRRRQRRGSGADGGTGSGSGSGVGTPRRKRPPPPFLVQYSLEEPAPTKKQVARGLRPLTDKHIDFVCRVVRNCRILSIRALLVQLYSQKYDRPRNMSFAGFLSRHSTQFYFCRKQGSEEIYVSLPELRPTLGRYPVPYEFKLKEVKRIVRRAGGAISLDDLTARIQEMTRCTPYFDAFVEQLYSKDLSFEIVEYISRSAQPFSNGGEVATRTLEFLQSRDGGRRHGRRVPIEVLMNELVKGRVVNQSDDLKEKLLDLFEFWHMNTIRVTEDPQYNVYVQRERVNVEAVVTVLRQIRRFERLDVLLQKVHAVMENQDLTLSDLRRLFMSSRPMRLYASCKNVKNADGQNEFCVFTGEQSLAKRVRLGFNIALDILLRDRNGKMLFSTLLEKMARKYRWPNLVRKKKKQMIDVFEFDPRFAFSRTVKLKQQQRQ